MLFDTDFDVSSGNVQTVTTPSETYNQVQQFLY
ncbi:MAG: aromatic-ring-hydroxylating dioxygenase subunit beta, partial [Candidimonas sp.]